MSSTEQKTPPTTYRWCSFWKAFIMTSSLFYCDVIDHMWRRHRSSMMTSSIVYYDVIGHLWWRHRSYMMMSSIMMTWSAIYDDDIDLLWSHRSSILTSFVIYYDVIVNDDLLSAQCCITSIFRVKSNKIFHCCHWFDTMLILHIFYNAGRLLHGDVIMLVVCYMATLMLVRIIHLITLVFSRFLCCPFVSRVGPIVHSFFLCDSVWNSLNSAENRDIS